MNYLYKILLISIITTTSLFAMQENEIKPKMEIKINKATFILRNKTLSKDEKQTKIFALLNDAFDYSLMAKIALGRKYKKITLAQRNNFIKAYEKKLKSSYIDKLNLYTDEQVVVKELKKVKKSRIILYTDLVAKDNIFKINYKFYRNKKAQWFIYDVELLGTSIIQADRIQFKNYLKDHTVAQLIKIM